MLHFAPIAQIERDTLTLFLLGLGGGGLTGGGNGSSGGRVAGVGEHVVDVSSLHGLGEESGPVALDGVAGSLDDLVQFFFLWGLD